MKNDIVLPVTPEQFAGCFSAEDWGLLCTDEKFLAAIQAQDWDQAEVIAWAKFMKRDQAEISLMAEVRARHDRLHEAARQFVSVWAKATGKTGGKWKQSRQNHIRRLMKNGLASDYAAKMAGEAKLN